MNIYKFKDLTDGKHAFILAKTQEQAKELLQKQTSLKFELLDARDCEELGQAFILVNQILPF